jgi:hypothetical protein
MGLEGRQDRSGHDLVPRTEVGVRGTEKHPEPTAAGSSDSAPLGPSVPAGSEPKDTESAPSRNSVTAAGERDVVRALRGTAGRGLSRARHSLLDALRALEEVR